MKSLKVSGILFLYDYSFVMDSLTPIELSVAFAADAVWQTPSPFQKKSQELWIELNRVKNKNVSYQICGASRLVRRRLSVYLLGYC